MISHYLDDLVQSSSNILLLQGPIGSFFYDLSMWLQHQQKTVFKINFNAGDEFFYPNDTPNTVAYRDSLEQFAQYLENFLNEHQIYSIVCLGDSRKYHQIAKAVAQKLSLSFWVFEEGYFRPDYITLEKDGVNAFSTIPRTAEHFLALENQLPEIVKPKRVAKGFLPMAKRAVQYYFSAYFCRSRYPEYRHHRILNVNYYLKLWSVSAFKRLCYFINDRNFAKRVEKGEFGEFFILPLQVYDDSQILVHSDYASVADFLREVIQSFVRYAPNHLKLIVKHHPMDRGFIDYQKVIDECCADFPNLCGRIFYVHDVPMPVFLRHAKGMVTLNSTSGISALLHNLPVKTLGRAHYDIDGLTYQGELATFWDKPPPPNAKLFSIYRRFHLAKTQINGSFYSYTLLSYPYNVKL